ncbi:hypothetical protein [Streptomyces sp. 900105245]
MNELHDTAVALQGDIAEQTLLFREDLNTYTRLAFGNSVLVAVGNIVQMDDGVYRDFMACLGMMSTSGMSADVRLTFSDLDLTLLRAVGNLELLTQNFSGFSANPPGFSEELGEGLEEAADSLLEPEELGKDALLHVAKDAVAEIFGEMPFGAIGAIGVNVFLAVGLEVIMSALNGQEEAQALDEEINRFSDAISKSRAYYNTMVDKRGEVQVGVVAEEKRFSGLVHAVSSIGINDGCTPINPVFDYNFDTTLEQADNFVGAVKQAVKQYETYVLLRELWTKYAANKRQVGDQPSRLDFVQRVSVLEVEPPAVIDHYFEILSLYSNDMASASR